MKHIQAIAALYEQYDTPRTFADDIAAHLHTGYVVNTPDFFLLARGVDRHASPEDLDNPWHHFPRFTQNTWLIYAFAGVSQNILQFIPYRLTWVTWQRRGKPLRFHTFNRATRLCASVTRSQIPSS